MSIPSTTPTSSSKTSLSPEIMKNKREASFSSFLDGAEETFVLKLDGATTPVLSSSLRKYADDREIDIFDAEKYFNDGLNHTPKVGTKNSSSLDLQKDDQVEILTVKEKPQIAALSIRSESSWNSRSGLLQTVSRNQNPEKVNKKSFLATIGCNCSCYDNDSANIDECVGENSSIKIEMSRKGDKVRKSHSSGHFSFPVVKNQLLKEKDETEKRKSGEIFGPKNGKHCFSTTKKTTWEATAPNLAEEIKIPSIDSDSDTSSDLFEIESLSRGNPFLTDSLSRTPTTCYAPSEGSIEWSVVTARAADFSVVSDSEEVTSNVTMKKVGVNSKIGSFKEVSRLRPSILLGCKNHGAVSVAGDAHRGGRRQLRVESFTPLVTQFHDESKLSFDA